jgi:hypothetical protein
MASSENDGASMLYHNNTVPMSTSSTSGERSTPAVGLCGELRLLSGIRGSDSERTLGGNWYPTPTFAGALRSISGILREPLSIKTD